MMRSVLVFLVAFLAGSVIALVVRTAVHQPYAPPAPAPVPGGDAPHAHPAPATAAPVAAPAAATGSGAATVNSTCPICGMAVDPTIPAGTWEGKAIGFGCAACPAIFAADPGRYGPAALKNEVVE